MNAQETNHTNAPEQSPEKTPLAAAMTHLMVLCIGGLAGYGVAAVLGVGADARVVLSTMFVLVTGLNLALARQDHQIRRIRKALNIEDTAGPSKKA